MCLLERLSVCELICVCECVCVFVFLNNGRMFGCECARTALQNNMAEIVFRRAYLCLVISIHIHTYILYIPKFAKEG